MGAEHRKFPRRRVEQFVLMMWDNAIIGQCTMLDVSAGGARLKLNGDLTVPDQFTLLLSKIDGRLKRQCVVAWRKEKQIGVRFVAAGVADPPIVKTA
ncbi:MAG: PilZ domain-containing protein [Alphaproteobacteria bacterium]